MQDANDDQEMLEPVKSSGLIRGAIFGAIFLLAIIGAIALVTKLIQSGANTSPEIAEFSAQDVSQNYKVLTSEWSKAKVVLKNAKAAEKTIANKLSDTRAKSTAQNAILKEVEASFSRSAASVATSKNKAEEAEDEVAAFLDNSLEDLVANASGNLDAYMANKKEAEAKYVSAKQEAIRIKSAVEHLKKASVAAAAAAIATTTVANAADAAQLIVDENEDVLPDTDGSTLLNLRNDFFNEAKAQADSANRSAKAAERATVVSLKKLEQAESRVADRQEIFNLAKVSVTQARDELAKLAKQLETLQAKRIAARKKSEIAKARVISEQARLEQGKVTLAKETTKNEDLKSAIKSLEKDHNTQVAKISVAQENYNEAEVNLRGAQKMRAKKRASTVASLNSDMHDKLRSKLGSLNIENPEHDRFIVPSETLFASGSATLGDEGKVLVKNMAEVIMSVTSEMPDDVDWMLRVDGHTDNAPIRGTGTLKDNWELSQARALAVVRYLVEEGKMLPKRLAANGLGEFQPLKFGDTEADRTENRRIELVLVPR
jgi:chemotaxis protein MotB